MKRIDATAADFALLFLRVSASLLVLIVHGLPKLLHVHAQLSAIEDPLHLGAAFTLGFAIFAEVVCPLLMIAGVFTRLAALPILVVCVVALALVHPDWSIEQGQFAWMLLILFGTVAIGGAGRYRVRWPRGSLGSREAA
ncbi:LysR family transcriptional regulator [Burkholderia sp. SRS-W-2-2016]|uniref:DoxX family protein n=1 Tax=Burkholderia sp. SRS-W-2-2016 TaxID=1926878 RepID=UPI00094B0243|nr:DoxX family protein [Burkholderia sp. SRS-W-2-2016]OLL29251.1 LysR family transcriptional regulator [Burkholderia sp. SRS-W-2-2016]